MPLTPIQLDTRSQKEIFEEARLRIQHYTPEWTDYNESDPGTTLLQLFAWMTESILFQLNRVPERNYLKFLQLIGMELTPARPASAHLTFTVKESAVTDRLGFVPQGARVGGQSPETNEQIIFETEEGLDLIPLNMEAVQVFDGVGFEDVTQRNTEKSAYFHPLGAQPQVDSALYFGFGPGVKAEKEWEAPYPQNLTETRRRFPSKMAFFVFKSPEAREKRIQSTVPTLVAYPTEPPLPPHPLLVEISSLLEEKEIVERYPSARWNDRRVALVESVRKLLSEKRRSVADPVGGVRLVWEYRPFDAPTTWRTLRVRKDESDGLTEEGYVHVEGPSDIVPTLEGRFQDDYLYWIRCRVAGGRYPGSREPRVDFIRANTVQATSLTTRREEIVGVSTGRPDQSFALQRRPIEPGSLQLEVVVGDEAGVPWRQNSDPVTAGPDDPQYELNVNTGVIRFPYRTPPPGSTIVARQYRFGGGSAANLDAGLINVPLTNIRTVQEVINERAAVGGSDEQGFKDIADNVQVHLRQTNRAVTAKDFALLAKRIGGVARAHSLPLAHPDFPGTPIPGAVSVVVVPQSDDRPPRPTPALLKSVMLALDEHRLLTSELHVREPQYYGINVRARVLSPPTASFGEVEQKIVEALDAYLSPLPVPSPDTPGGYVHAGWAFGRDLYPRELFGVIQGVGSSYVAVVTDLEIYMNKEPHPLNEPIRLPPYGLVFSLAPHEIVVEPNVDL